MLLAQKEQIRLAASAVPEDLPNVGSFGKVVNSIQGLQQRLESFSAEDVGAAHDRTQTLLLRLADLQRKLTRFAVIKESMAAVRCSLDQMLTDCVDLGKLETLEKPLRIQTLIHANKLIQFPRLNKLVNASSHQVAPDSNETVTTHSTVDNDCAQPPETNQDVNEQVDPELLHDTCFATSELQSAPQHETLTATSVEQENRADNPVIPPAADLSPTTGLDSVVEVESTAPELEEQPTPSYEPQVPEGARADTAKSAAKEEKTNDAFAVTTSTEFDQRLLDDLIKNYGEFAVSLSSSRTSETPVSGDADGTEIDSDDRVQPIEVVPERNNLPSIKKEGDLDRQLKKIIKDYGEYDLYSRQSPVNLKTGVVAAFLLLALILSGFYYFSPKTAGSQSSLNTAPTHTHSSNTTESKDSENLAPAAEAGAPQATETNSRPKSRK